MRCDVGEARESLENELSTSREREREGGEKEREK